MTAVFRSFGQDLLDEINRRAAKDVDDEFTLRVRAYIAAHTANKVVAISTTTKRRIRKAIDDGVVEGLGQREVAKRIVARTSGAIGRRRANVIARTETHQASVAGADEAMAVSGINELMVREWIAAEDDRTRESHLEVNGETRPMGEPFQVGGATLMYPGDPAANAPGETINCRCVLGYLPADEVT